MASEGSSELEQAFSKLQQLIDAGQHQKALKAVDTGKPGSGWSHE